MQNIFRQLMLLGCVGSAVFAAPFLAIGDNAELFVTGTAGVRYDDNILLVQNNARQDDVISQFVPGLALEFGKDTLLKGSLTAQETLNSYRKNSELNTQLGAVALDANYDNGKLKLGVNASYTQLDQATYAVNATNIRRDVTNAGVTGEYSLTEKTSIGSGLTYSETRYLTGGSVNEKDYGVPVNVYYGITPKIDLSSGVTYRRTDLSDNTSYDNYYYNVGSRGEFTPKIKGHFSVGYNDRLGHGITAKNGGGFGMQSGLTYLYSEKTRFTLDASRDFSNGSNGDSQEASSVTLGGQTDITAAWRANVSVTYRKIDAQTLPPPSRTDEYFEGSIGVTYVINANLSVNGSYLHRSNYTTNAPTGSFIDNVVSLSISARY